MTAPVVGGQAVGLEYSALLGLPVSEATIRKVVRYNPAVRDALRAALRELPEVAAAAPSSTLERAAELAKGADSQRSTGEVYAILCAAAQARVVRGLDLPSSVKSWKQIQSRAKAYGSELLANTLVLGENNYEAAAQAPEALAQVELRYARLSEAGKRRVVAKATSYGEAAVSFDQVAHYAKARNEVAELAALVGAQLAKERAAEAKKEAAKPSPLGTPQGSKAPVDNPRARRTTQHHDRRHSAGKA